MNWPAVVNGALLLSALAVALVLYAPQVRNRDIWRATVTPLASIIGSGFLVLGPILVVSYGSLAPVAMAALVGTAALFGHAISTTIGVPEAARPLAAGRIEHLASLALGFAYVVSVAYYLNLFGAFAARLLDLGGDLPPRVLTTAAYLVILALGLGRGFQALETAEEWTVSFKMVVIAGLLAALGVHMARLVAEGAAPVWNPPSARGWEAITLALGLLITVQGFETAKYLAAYPPPLRIRAMRLALAISGAVYLLYAVLIALTFKRGEVPLSETGVIDMMAAVSGLLPPMLMLAALSAQFSAAVADTVGAAGMLLVATGRRLRERLSYALLVATGLGLTWGADVFSIIAYASRAFAIYYALQAALAAVIARASGKGSVRAGPFWALCALGVAIALFGRPVE